LHYYDPHDKIFETRPHLDIFIYFLCETCFSKGRTIYYKAGIVLPLEKEKDVPHKNSSK
jgi:hypothetical protein